MRLSMSPFQGMWNSLPVELQMLVFTFLDHESKKRLCLTCREIFTNRTADSNLIADAKQHARRLFREQRLTSIVKSLLYYDDAAHYPICIKPAVSNALGVDIWNIRSRDVLKVDENVFVFRKERQAKVEIQCSNTIISVTYHEQKQDMDVYERGTIFFSVATGERLEGPQVVHPELPIDPAALSFLAEPEPRLFRPRKYRYD